MITLEEACKIYESRSPWPIKRITENETEWAFIPATDGGCYGVDIDIVNKKTGQVSNGFKYDYTMLPDVPIPAPYVKDPPPRRFTDALEALIGISFADLEASREGTDSRH